VFVSYAHEDEQTAKGLVADLNQRGIKGVWFAPRQLQPGDHLDGKIRNAIDRAGYFVVLITQESKNSRWVAKEIEHAIEREKERHIPRIIPLYLRSRDIPESLENYLGIGLRESVYKAGFEDLVAVISGEMSQGRTPLDKFERFIKSLPIVDEDTAKAIEGLQDEYHFLRRDPSLASESTVNHRLQQVEILLAQKELPSIDRQRIVAALRRDLWHLPPCLLESELRAALHWLRSTSPATLGAAAFLYDVRYVGGSRHLKRNLASLVTRWVSEVKSLRMRHQTRTS
jgi:TIR domain